MMAIRKVMIPFIMFLLYILPSATKALSLASNTDKLALLDLKQKLTNSISDSLPSWNDSVSFCTWQGVTCSPSNMRVSSLQLQNQDWGGTLGPSIGNLTFLQNLNLSNINLHGEIPREVGNLKKLQVLDLSHNNLKGEIIHELSNCSSLQVISLIYNNLTGNVPSWFGSMVQLTQLLLGANNLVGTIPLSLGNLSSLVEISLGRNHLEGSIPYTLGKLINLKHLLISSNNLSGIVPDSLYNLTNVEVIDLGGNQISGTIPSNIDLFFPNLEIFLIGQNQFSGTFPSSISNITRLKWLEIVENSFEGSIPLTLGSLSELELFNIAANSFGSGKAHDLDFLYSLTNCTQLELITFEANKFGGALPDIISNFSTNLETFIVQDNQISGVIPEGIGQLISLSFLAMGKNFLEGSIPDSIKSLKLLENLDLQQNRLSGNIPTSIGNLTVLSELYLNSNNFEGRIPSNIRYCTMLHYFNASGNKLSGDISNETFGNQEGLINLDLSKNSFTGLIPSGFGNMNHLSMLYLQYNNFSGEIPMELGACTTLTMLGLANNSLQGTIPSFLTTLRSLQLLDLSNNQFSGTIPSRLENLTLLNTLDLSFNHLYGEVPIGGVFSNITKFSLIGNKDLCGGIPQLKFPACPSSRSKKHKWSYEKRLIIIIVSGGILIFFIILISLYYLKKKAKVLSSSPSMKNKYLRVSYGELHQATDGFSSMNLVGTGSFGSVYKGTLPYFERPVAIKVLNLQTRGGTKSFVAECNALGKIKHRNLVNILTCCSSVDYKGEDFKAIVFEFMPNGSLENLLHNNEQHEPQNLNLNLQQRISIALDVAHALDYLQHESQQAIVHCDIKPSNIILDDDIVAHLGDFGLAKLLQEDAIYSIREQAKSSTIKGTIGYVPPEYGAGGLESPQGDIYSYGILLLEILTGKRPTDSMFGEGLSLHNYCKMAIPEGITEVADARLLTVYHEEQMRITQHQQEMEDKFKECLVSLARIGVVCSDEFPAQRMNIKDVIVELHAMKQKLLH
ncbi:hypothetical protein TanjilG_22447 [Lupinus angustifolius]|uniref:non-specific serine/threonine protein kinase n=1 Tax=Lupinus angustifolius TaxID=3871 RepID=A0A4P1RSZ8_LUPAN|nr:PREDICTED: probable LRR receptor-like serine/threonine-protein kinase At3g47570 [Lupinus angustifolius]OIW17335.1 hypothetical protein TanjilG_22447 [Lupinus angustifolius]